MDERTAEDVNREAARERQEKREKLMKDFEAQVQGPTELVVETGKRLTALREKLNRDGSLNHHEWQEMATLMQSIQTYHMGFVVSQFLQMVLAAEDELGVQQPPGLGLIH